MLSSAANWLDALHHALLWAADHNLITPALAVLSLVLAGFAYRASWKIASRRATLDLIEKAESGEHYRAAQQCFRRYRVSAQFATLHGELDEGKAADRERVIFFLNHYELIALGIRRKVLEGSFYRRWMRGPLLRDWKAIRDFVQRERWKWNEETQDWDYYPGSFSNYEWLARRWDRTIRPLTHTTGGKPDATAAKGPGDELLPAPDPDDA